MSKAAQPSAQPSSPLTYPWLTQVLPARSLPSHTSPASMTPLPQTGPVPVHAEVSNAPQSGAHARIPPSKPRLSQV